MSILIDILEIYKIDDIKMLDTYTLYNISNKARLRFK